MNTREQSAAIKKTVVENDTREFVLEHACELVETFPVSKEKALILSVTRSWDLPGLDVSDHVNQIIQMFNS